MKTWSTLLTATLVVSGVITVIAQTSVPTTAPSKPLTADQRTLANLRSIGQALMLYVSEHRGALPADFIDLQNANHQQLTRSIFIDPEAHPDVVEQIQAMPQDEFDKWLLAKSAYVYIDLHAKITRFRATETPIVIQRGSHKNIGVLYLDGHAELFAPAVAKKQE